ncbi:MAG: LacI family DNA-binding transcriptional regulator [Spirochaetia bacterium]|nr:LacI family DNA-binding transcriptional regulator [Spirochaetia bacterium]
MTGHKMNIHDIAEKAGVSYMTVSRVVNGSAQVSRKTRHAVEKVIRENRFVPSQAASAVRKKTQTLVGLVLPRLEYAFYESFVNAFTESCMAAGLEPEIHLTLHDSASETRQVLALASRRALGIVVASAKADDPLIDTAKKYIQKIIVLGAPDDERAKSGGHFYIGFDEEKVASLASSALLGAGHRKILVVSSTPLQFKTTGKPSRRLGYFEKKCLAGGGEVASVLDLDNQNYDEIVSPEALAGLLDKSGATAAFCENDFAAHKIYAAAAKAGVRIPRDLSVVGVDDVFSSKYLSPALTTVALPYEEAVPEIVGFFSTKSRRESFTRHLVPVLRTRDSLRKI